ncbi:RNA polymerase factor sigma-54 [candidate division KSB1 bacterium]|nr:RNA polymerase factor sigma-54 [candidate division KSB1 bacterium]
MMSLSQKLSMQLKQSPQQVLLSSLLQLPTMSLEQRIKTELELNPLLEIDQSQDEELDQEQEAIEEMALIRKEATGSDTEDERPEEEKEIDWDTILTDEDNYEVKAPKDTNSEEFERPEVSQSTLPENLLDQLYMVRLTEQQYLIGENLIWNINNVGYLSTPVDTIATNLGVSIAEVEEVLNIIHFFEPVGIGARNLQECLIIQLKDKDDIDPLTLDILTNYFEDFKNKRFEKIAKKMAVSLEVLKDAIDEIRKLNPKPGEGFLSENTNYVVPDLIVEKVDGDFQVELLDWNIPNLRINNSYRKLLLDKKNTSKETKEYIKQRLESARWLINSIHQRRITIKKVMEAIVKKQEKFFDYGPNQIRPMILKDIADEINMDISTVSRVTNGKYVQTDWGVFELKFFFSEKIHQDDGEDVSNKKIKSRIREIIELENSRRPLNDQKIAELLKKEGSNVARRTVAKYREQMMIPVSRLRRKI